MSIQWKKRSDTLQGKQRISKDEDSSALLCSKNKRLRTRIYQLTQHMQKGQTFGTSAWEWPLTTVRILTA